MGKLMLGDSLEKLKLLPDNSVDSVVTDPPYGLSFMGKQWDYDVPTVEIWKECLRVLKPGGHLLAFGGTRTYHRLVVAIEDAGFEIRDQIQWLYGQGFPKSYDIAQSLEKLATIGVARRPDRDLGKGRVEGSTGHGYENLDTGGKVPLTDETAKKWSGWGTALKPANEPICLARKPLSEKTVAKNVLKHGTGGLNIDASRIGYQEGDRLRHNEPSAQKKYERDTNINFTAQGIVSGTDNGRFPSNVILDEDAAEVLDEQTQHLHGAGSARGKGQAIQTNDGGLFGVGNHAGNGMRFGDSGGASRFFYVAKASKSDRGTGNIHPTVKPTKLMEYLIKLVTPEGGTVLDPFMGSGTTGVAARTLGFDFIGCELSPEYFEIAKARIIGAKKEIA